MNIRNLVPPSAGIRHEQAETTVVWNGEGLGSGTLYVADTIVAWCDGYGKGFSLEYPSISLHAISRDLTAYPKEHLYVMVSAQFKENAEKDELGDDSSDEENDKDEDFVNKVTEIRFVPSDIASLGPMFLAMSECQALHPDPDDSDSDFEGDEYDVEEAEQGQIDLITSCNFDEALDNLTLEGQSTLVRLEGMLAQSTSQDDYLAGLKSEDTT